MFLRYKVRKLLSSKGYFRQKIIRRLTAPRLSNNSAGNLTERLCTIQAVLGSIPGGDQIFLILYCKHCERERIHLMSKRRLRKKLSHSETT